MTDAFRSYLVADDVLQIRAPFENGFVNFYAVRRPDGLDLVDAGSDWPGIQDAVAEILRQFHPQGVAAIRRIYLTHSHVDHLGIAAWVQGCTGAPCFVDHGEISYLERRLELSDPDFAWWLVQNGAPPQDAPGMVAAFPHITCPIPALTPLPAPNAGSSSWRAISTPGHSPGHVCYYDAQRQLLCAGDHLFKGGPPYVGIYPGMDNQPLVEYLAGLNALAALPVRMVLPGHGGPFESLADTVDRVQATMATRQQEVLAAVRDGAQLAFRVGLRVFPAKVPMVSTVARPLAHLQVLAARGLVRAEDQQWLPA